MKYSKDSILTTGIITITILLLAGLVFYLTYQWQNSKVIDLQNQVTQLKLQQDENTKHSPSPSNSEFTYASTKGTSIKVYAPLKKAKVTSPLAIIGEVPGNWSFEASFPVSLKDSSGKVVAQASAQLLGNWMTTELVPFSLKLPYITAAPGNGSLILKKDNPSGLPQNDDSVTIPVTFNNN